jgi:mercuric ion binding protein
MKNMLVMVFALFTLTSFSQKKIEQIIIQTSAECGSCKERLEGKLNYTKGIKFADLDIPSKKLTVKFKTNKISEEEILKIVSDLGYDADNLKANPKAYEALPQCCKVNGMEHDEGK